MVRGYLKDGKVIIPKIKIGPVYVSPILLWILKDGENKDVISKNK